jgi:hypothetical protein
MIFAGHIRFVLPHLARGGIVDIIPFRIRDVRCRMIIRIGAVQLHFLDVVAAEEGQQSGGTGLPVNPNFLIVNLLRYRVGI